MIPELGHLALILALCLAATQAWFGIVGAQRGDQVWMAAVRPAAVAQALFVLVAFVALAYSFLVSDFSVQYVAENSNVLLPWPYKITAVWGAHEGSLLLWVTVLGIWTLAASLFSRHLPQEFAARVLGVMGLVSLGFFLFMLTTSDPFTRLLPAAEQGRDLNPILQDPAMAKLKAPNPKRAIHNRPDGPCGHAAIYQVIQRQVARNSRPDAKTPG